MGKKAPDEIGDSLVNLKPDDSDRLEPRRNLSDKEKFKLMEKVGGPKTLASIVGAKKDFSIARIPWIFNSIDSQSVIDILYNDMSCCMPKDFDKKARKKDPKK